MAPLIETETNLSPVGQFVLYVLLLFIGMIMFLKTTYVPISKYLLIAEQPIVIEGKVVDLEIEVTSGYRPIVEFTDRSGKVHRMRSWTYYEAPFSPSKGDRLPVRYAAKNPAVATIDTSWSTWGSLSTFGVLAGFFCFACSWQLVINILAGWRYLFGPKTGALKT